MEKTINVPKIDKSNWPDGPWKNEPDRVEFKHEGFDCLIQRVPHGNLCGYVAMPPGHPWHGKHYDDLEGIEVHGGLTFSEECGGGFGGAVCHVPSPGEPDNVWWLGFDMAHAWDYAPNAHFCNNPEMIAYRLMGFDDLADGGGEYRTVEYVTEECKKLAAQAIAVQNEAVAA